MSDVVGYSIEEITVNNGKNGKPCWMIYKNDVYDVTSFLTEHPGGEDLILDYGGKNATKAFNEAGHSSDATRTLSKYKIGIFSSESITQNQCENQNSFENIKTNKTEKRRCFKLFFCS